jgi:hypothetical protein
MNIYSKINITEVLHIINRKSDIKDSRTDLVEPYHHIQVSSFKLFGGQTFRPHYHITKLMPPTGIPQESWVIITGLVKVILYDIDNTILHTDVLEPGDCSITLRGGHNYECLQPSVIYEFKTGPYLGQENDKEFI